MYASRRWGLHKNDGEIKLKNSVRMCMYGLAAWAKATNSLMSFITTAETFYGWRRLFYTINEI